VSAGPRGRPGARAAAACGHRRGTPTLGARSRGAGSRRLRSGAPRGHGRISTRRPRCDHAGAISGQDRGDMRRRVPMTGIHWRLSDPRGTPRRAKPRGESTRQWRRRLCAQKPGRQVAPPARCAVVGQAGERRVPGGAGVGGSAPCVSKTCDADHPVSVTRLTARRRRGHYRGNPERRLWKGPIMNSARTASTLLHVGDQVILQGTRIAGDVVHIEGHRDHARISIKVTEVLGKKPTSKTARAWRGAWVTCAPAMVATILPSSN